MIGARDGAEGLQAARRELPDLIVSDIMMPKLDGIAMMRTLARDPDTGAIPVILLTAKSAESDELEGLKSGAVDYLTKPFAPEILLARAYRLLGFAQQLREQMRSEWADRARLAEESPKPPGLRERLHTAVLKRLDDPSLNVSGLAGDVFMSRSGLKRAMNEAGLPPPSEFIRQTRLSEAADLLARKRGSVTEVCYAVGFGSLSHFSHCFRSRYGVAPSAYAGEEPPPP